MERLLKLGTSNRICREPPNVGFPWRHNLVPYMYPALSGKHESHSRWWHEIWSLPEPGMSRVLYHLHHLHECITRASLVAQWLRVHLPTQETPVPSPIWDNPMRRGAAEPLSHSYWACAPQPGALTREASPTRSLCTTAREQPCSPQPENEEPPQ